MDWDSYILEIFSCTMATGSMGYVAGMGGVITKLGDCGTKESGKTINTMARARFITKKLERSSI